MTPPTLGVILAGGLASRMGGGDKPLLRLAGRTLLDRVVERLQPQCSAGLMLSANGDLARFSGFPGPILPDGVVGNPGPLAGILAALDFAAASQDGAEGRIVSVSGDAPFIPRDLVARLYSALNGLDDGRIALAASTKQHFTVALWPVALRHDLRAALVEHDERRVGAFIARHGAAVASWPVEPFDPFLNINEPADLATAEALLADLRMTALL